MDFGKFKYEREKGEREHGKKQKESELKQIRIGFLTGKHDLERQAEQIQKFLERGDTVQIQMRLRGREKALKDTAFKKFNEFLAIIPTEITLDQPPQKLPQGIVAIISRAHKKHEKSDS